MSAAKDLTNKPDLSLVSYHFKCAIARVMMLGEKKYGRWNYRKGHEVHLILAAIERHLGKFAEGEDLDDESGESHLAHIAADCMMIVDQMREGTWKDTRYKKPTTATRVRYV